jgi:hypothetical protein
VASQPQLMDDRCATCVFRPGNLMRLAPGRLAELVEHNLAVGAALICHDTLPYGARPEVGETVCRGWYDAYGPRTTSVQVFERLGGTFLLIPAAGELPADLGGDQLGRCDGEQPAGQRGDPGGRVGGAADVDGRPDVSLLGHAQPAAHVEREPGPLPPLTGGRVAEPVQRGDRAPLAEGAAVEGPPRSHRGVPDRPAEARLESFIAAVHGDHDGEPGRVDPPEPRVQRLDAQPAVVGQRDRGGGPVRDHDPDGRPRSRTPDSDIDKDR